MIDEIIDLRNETHRDAFRFLLTHDHWNVLYMPEKVEASHLATVTKDGKLEGYAVFYLVNFDQIRAYDVREIIAEDESTLAQLLDQIRDKGMEESIDFIFLKRCEEPYSDLLVKRGFSPFVESVIMTALFDPQKLLSTLSQKTEDGKTLRLDIRGFDLMDIKVGEERIMLTKEEKPNLLVSMDSKTFLRLFFGKSSFMRELIRRKVTISNILGFATASRFFKIIEHDKWYIPMGDWV
jgi:hypothetical protein